MKKILILFLTTLINAISADPISANWTGNYTQWSVQPNNITVTMDQCCNITTANITHIDSTINMTLNFNASNTNCPDLSGIFVIEEIPYQNGLLIYDPLVLNGLIGVYIMTNNTIALSSGFGNCVWIMGNNNNSKITNISAYTFHWGGDWTLGSSYGLFPEITTCCTPTYPLHIKYDAKTQTVNYTMIYQGLSNDTNGTNGTNSTTTLGSAAADFNITDNSTNSTGNLSIPAALANCPMNFWGLNYTMNTSISGGSFFDNTSLFVAFSLSNGSILVHTQSCLMILNQFGMRLLYSYFNVFVILSIFYLIH
jgi:hypothetical protein